MHAQMGVQLSANASVDLLQALHMPCSRNTVLRGVRQLPMPPCHTPRVMGVDDWAFRKGKRYGTILVDLEQHRVIDLLPDRSATTLSAWLEAHPGIEIITRDRASEYSRAIKTSAPHALQIADRFHLVQNLGTTTKAWLERRKNAVFDTLAQIDASKPPTPDTEVAKAKVDDSQTNRAVHLQTGRPHRLEQYQNALTLAAKGIRPRVVARRLEVPESTVRFWLNRGAFPTRLGRRTALKQEHEELIRQRWLDGCSNAAELHRELMALGCNASKSVVTRFVAFLRCGEPLSLSRSKALEAGITRGARCSVSDLSRLLVTPVARLGETARGVVGALCQGSEEIRGVYALIQELRTLLIGDCDGCERRLNGWIERTCACGVGELQRLGSSMRKDFHAITAGLTHKWSNGQTEGQVTKLKLVKRQRYGRASLDLLRRCVLLS